MCDWGKEEVVKPLTCHLFDPRFYSDRGHKENQFKVSVSREPRHPKSIVQQSFQNLLTEELSGELFTGSELPPVPLKKISQERTAGTKQRISD